MSNREVFKEDPAIATYLRLIGKASIVVAVGIIFFQSNPPIVPLKILVDGGGIFLASRSSV